MDAGVNVYPGGRIVLHALPLKALIVAAYDAGYWQLSGGDDWMGKDLFDVEAKPAQQSGTYSLRHTRFDIGDERVRQMLQTLLTERFRLKIHRETKTRPSLPLETSGKTFLPHSTKYTEDQPAIGAPGFSGEIEHVGGQWFLFNASMPQLAKFASNYVLHKPVSIRRGWRDRSTTATRMRISTRITAISKPRLWLLSGSIGLKLTSSKGPVETFVIEHAEKPSAN